MTQITDSAINAAKFVLAKCAATDPWFPKGGEALVLSWAEQFALAGIPVDDLVAGVVEAYRVHGSGFRPLPADIIGAARMIRRDRAERRALDERAEREALIDRKAMPQIHELAQALTIDLDPTPPRRPARGNPRARRCPWCHAGIGDACADSSGRKLRNYHPIRTADCALCTALGVSAPAAQEVWHAYVCAEHVPAMLRHQSVNAAIEEARSA